MCNGQVIYLVLINSLYHLPLHTYIHTKEGNTMIKKITLASVATLALLFIPAQAEGNKCAAGKSGAGMMEKCKVGNIGKQCPKYMNRHGSALLVYLPSPMRMLKKIENDPKLALTAEQKSKLEAQRNEMMPKMMKLKEEIRTVSRAIKDACKKNVPAAEQKANVEKLAKLKTEATMMKLTCIDGVKAILNKEQQAYIRELRQTKMGQMRENMRGQGQGQMQGKGQGQDQDQMNDTKC